MTSTIRNILAGFILLTASCTTPPSGSQEKTVPVIGFIDYVEDATLAQAKMGFLNALRDSGFSEETGTLNIIYRNAQGDQPTLLQAVDYIVSKGVSPDRITAKGYGEERLVNQCKNGVACTKAEHRLNRRTEFTVTGLE